MYTSPSPLPRRAPLRLPFSVHIRKLFFLFLSLFSGAPRWTHPVGAGVPDGPHRFSSTLPTGLFRAPMDAPVGAGVPDGPHRFSSTLPAGLFRTPTDAPRRGRRPRRPVFRSPIAGCTRVLHVCLRRPYFFQQRKKYGKERRQRPMVFGIPFVRLQSRRKKVPQRIACTSIPAAAPTPRAAALCSPNIKIGGPKGRTYTCRRRRQVRDLIIAQIGRPANLL